MCGAFHSLAARRSQEAALASRSLVLAVAVPQQAARQRRRVEEPPAGQLLERIETGSCVCVQSHGSAFRHRRCCDDLRKEWKNASRHRRRSATTLMKCLSRSRTDTWSCGACACESLRDAGACWHDRRADCWEETGSGCGTHRCCCCRSPRWLNALNVLDAGGSACRLCGMLLYESAGAWHPMGWSQCLQLLRQQQLREHVRTLPRPLQAPGPTW
jgi:hypothetical protein